MNSGEFEGEEYISFGSGNFDIDNVPTEKRKKSLAQDTPKTEAETEKRSSSFLSCGNYNTASTFNVPKKQKIARERIKTQSKL